MANRIQIRKDIAGNWTGANPILAQGEPGFETDTLLIKFGDGILNWNSLPYYSTSGLTVNELAAINGSNTPSAGNVFATILDLSSFVETDPIFTASPSFSIGGIDIANWNTSFSWGDHSLAGYLTDAPSNGSTYGRNNGAWVVVTGGGGTQTLAQTLVLGNVSGGTNLLLTTGDIIGSSAGNTQIDLQGSAFVVTTDAGGFLTPYQSISTTQIELAGLSGGGVLLTNTSLALSHNTLIQFSNSPVRFNNLTATTVPYLDASKNLVSSLVTPTQLSYLDATSSIQTQLNSKQVSDADLTAIAALGFTATAFLKKTAANTWALDTNTYLTSFSESDPIFLASDAASITATDISNWNTAFSWGDHSLAGYLTAETDPVFVAWLAGPPNLSEFNDDIGFLTSESDPVWLADKANYLTSSTASSTYEPIITAGTTGQYWRGDKSWQTLNTAIVPELTNLYYTNARGIGSVLTGYTSGAGVVAATDTILQAIQKLNGNIGSIVSGVSSVNSLTGAVALTGTTNRITISAANVFDIGTDVVTLTGSQSISNKTIDCGTF